MKQQEQAEQQRQAAGMLAALIGGKCGPYAPVGSRFLNRFRNAQRGQAVLAIHFRLQT